MWGGIQCCFRPGSMEELIPLLSHYRQSLCPPPPLLPCRRGTRPPSCMYGVLIPLPTHPALALTWVIRPNLPPPLQSEGYLPTKHSPPLLPCRRATCPPSCMISTRPMAATVSSGRCCGSYRHRGWAPSWTRCVGRGTAAAGVTGPGGGRHPGRSEKGVVVQGGMGGRAGIHGPGGGRGG